jgi:hypothetical protein
MLEFSEGATSQVLWAPYNVPYKLPYMLPYTGSETPLNLDKQALLQICVCTKVQSIIHQLLN